MALSSTMTVTMTASKHSRTPSLSRQPTRSGPVCKRRKLSEASAVSYLDRLPLELLEQIYVESENAQLANTSKRLRVKLSSDHARRNLVSRVMRAEALSEQESEFDLHFAGFGQSNQSRQRQDCDMARRSLRAVIVQEWFTFKLLREAVVEWQFDLANHELKKFLLQYRRTTMQAEYPQAAKLLRECLEKSTVPMTGSDIAYFRDMKSRVRELEPWLTPEIGHPWKFQWPLEQDAPTMMQLAFLENPWEKKTKLGCVKLMVCSTKPTHRIMHKIFEKNFTEWWCNFDIVPSKWMSGPYTQNQGDLLKFFLDRMEDHYRDGEMAQEMSTAQIEACKAGVTSAILTNNSLAAHLLLSACSTMAKSPFITNLRRTIWESDRHEPMDQPTGESPWTCFTGMQMIYMRHSIPLVTVSPAQLYECIDGYHKHRFVSLQFFDHLAMFATRQHLLDESRLQKLRAISAEVRSGDDPFNPKLIGAADALLMKLSTLA